MKINLANIKKAIKHLNKNECVAIPTETVYGLSGNAYSNKACEKIFRLKKRPKDNPLIVHYYNNIQLRKDCNFDNRFLDLYKKFCPGPITFVLNLHKNSKISKIATNKRNSLAIRFPKHPVTRALLKKLKFPLAAPSANLSSKVSAVNSNDVKEDFGKKIKYVLEGGKSSIGLESTIVDLRNKPKILRLGGLEISTIQKVLKKKITKNIQAEARNARYDILKTFCKKNNIKVILTAHNLEDQVETFLIQAEPLRINPARCASSIEKLPLVLLPSKSKMADCTFSFFKSSQVTLPPTLRKSANIASARLVNLPFTKW